MSRTIGEIARATGFSPDALRYYEKFGLLPDILRDAGGRRRYKERDLERLHFIKRAQKMNFTLSEIANLLDLRDSGTARKSKARQLANTKLAEVEQHLAELELLRNELRLLINLCQSSSDDRCPIVDG